MTRKLLTNASVRRHTIEARWCSVDRAAADDDSFIREVRSGSVGWWRESLGARGTVRRRSIVDHTVTDE